MSLVISINGSLRPLKLPTKKNVEKIANPHTSEEVKEFGEEKKDLLGRPYSHKVVLEYENHQKKKDDGSKRVKFAYQIMTKSVLTLDPNEILLKAATLMKEKKIRHIPIVRERKVIGIISNEDILQISDLNQPVSSVMNTEVILAYESVTIELLATIFIEHKIGAIPIISRTNQLVGIISTIDILEYVVHSFPLRAFA